MPGCAGSWLRSQGLLCKLLQKFAFRPASGSVWDADPKAQQRGYCSLLAVVHWIVRYRRFWLFHVRPYTMTNLEKRGITTGFRFSRIIHPAGFGIATAPIELHRARDSYGGFILAGPSDCSSTLLVSVIGYCHAQTLIGLFARGRRLLTNWPECASAQH